MTLSSSDLKNCDGFMTSQIYFTTENRISRVMLPTLLFPVLWLYCSTFIIGHQTALFICIVRPAKAPQCSIFLMGLVVVKSYNNDRAHFVGDSEVFVSATGWISHRVEKGKICDGETYRII